MYARIDDCVVFFRLEIMRCHQLNGCGDSRTLLIAEVQLCAGSKFVCG